MKTKKNQKATKSHSDQQPAKRILPAECARKKAGFTLEEAAKRLNLTPRYLRQLECSGNASLKTARRLARLYGCSANIFVHSPEYVGQLGKRAIQVSKSTPTAGVNKGQNPFASRRTEILEPPQLTLVPGSNVRHRMAERVERQPMLSLVPSSERKSDQSGSLKPTPKRVSTHWSRRQYQENAGLLDRSELAISPAEVGAS